MRQPLPTFGPVFADREAIAQMFSLDPCTGYVRRVTHDEIADRIG